MADTSRRSRSGSRSRSGPGGTAASDAATTHDNPELLASNVVRTALIEGVTFRRKAVQYAVVEGRAMFEGDINLGDADALEQHNTAVRSGAGADVAEGVIITGSQYRWPQGRVPFEIDSAMADQNRVTDAIAHWEVHTAIRFVERTAANAGTYPNYVRFFSGSGCYSSVGMQSGSQDVSLGDGCTTGNAIHEIGHTVGLWHEQSREDRDSYVVIHWENIQTGMEHNFDQHISDGDDVGAYDYGSIMHYPRDAFSRNGQDTITPTNPSTASIGQRTALSAGDIAAVASMYGSGSVGVKKVVDDPPVGVKKISDDHVPIKKVVDDPPVGVKKISDDHVPIKKVVDDPPVGVKKISDDHVPIKKVVDDTRTIPGPVTGPGPISVGGLQPFLLATPHHADVGSADEVVAALEARLTAAASAVAEARRNVVALQTALTSAVSDLATAQENYSTVVAQIQQLG